jgi:hypothetical protein
MHAWQETEQAKNVYKMLIYRRQAKMALGGGGGAYTPYADGKR